MSAAGVFPERTSRRAPAVSESRFADVYRGAVRDVLSHWNAEMQLEISRHNVGWHPDRYRFDGYLEASLVRYQIAFRSVSRVSAVRRVCDVGGFWGVFPLTLARLGFEVSMTEALKYYSSSFAPLFAFLTAEGVSVVDYDPFEPGRPLAGPFDAVFVMAVLEHYPHSLRPFLENISPSFGRDGLVYIEVPNLAYWPKRMALLHGRSPNRPIADVYASAIPFTGHHHEFTKAELYELAGLAGLDVLDFHAFNYSSVGEWRARLRTHPFETFMLKYVPSAREILAILGRARRS